MRKFIFLMGFMAICLFASNTWGTGDLTSGSLSTPILYDSSAYGLPQDQRVAVANPPGGLVATAAWYQYGMRLDWTVIDNDDGTYTYHYLFGPGWYPATNGTGGTGSGNGNPYVTNKNITAWDIQLGADITSVSDLTNLKWNVYQFNGPNGSLVGRVGKGDATSYQKCNPLTGATSGSVVNTSLFSIGDLTGETGYTDQTTLDDYHVTSNLFHGLQWLNPAPTGNFLFPNDVNIELTFTSTSAPGWGNFFANSTRTGTNNNNSNVVAYDSSDTGYDPSMLSIPVNLNNKAVVPGVPTDPPTVISTTPADKATGVGIDAFITATFDEAMSLKTINSNTFFVDGLIGSVTYNAATHVATFTPSSALLNSTTYTATVTSGAKNFSGKAMAADKTWTFTTTAAPDTKPPTADITYSPAGPYVAGTVVTITATFSEAMADSPVPMIALSGADTLSAVNMTKTDASHYTYKYTAGPGTGDVTVTLSAGTDLSGNHVVPAPTSEATFTIDNTLPTVISNVPTNPPWVALDSTISVNFSEAINPSTINDTTFTVKDATGNLTGIVSYNKDDTNHTYIATFKPTSKFSYYTTYTATVTTGVKDLAGNDIAADKTWSFTTVPLYGDLKGTGKDVTIDDARIALQIAAGLATPTPQQTAAGDVAPLLNGKPNADGKVDISDVVAILMKLVGLANW